MIPEEHIEVRCSKEKPHGMFDSCGGLMGMLKPDIGHDLIMRCSCGAMWHVEYEPGQKFKLTAVKERVKTTTLYREVVC